jgi:hypothetical protein
MAKIFNYYEDISIDFNEKSFTVGELIEMNDKEFNICYQEFNTDIGEQIYNLKDSKTAQLEMLGISNSINTMERVRLERKINNK